RAYWRGVQWAGRVWRGVFRRCGGLVCCEGAVAQGEVVDSASAYPQIRGAVVERSGLVKRRGFVKPVFGEGRQF
ncbi:hypothetical protein, partial [Pyrobaculum sp.]|uniref:hypothetical protein n=1 Tax=Pyrobaculum sp. TaxID=2004705 RepID=UPI003D1224CD